jgi:hypothetical protein
MAHRIKIKLSNEYTAMKKLTIYIIAILFCDCVNAQQAFTNNGNLQIHSGASISGFGNFSNTSSGTLINNGTFYLKGNLSNDQASMTSGAGLLNLDGSSVQTISGSQVFKTYDLVTNNSSGITLNNNLSVSGTHTFTNGLITTSATPNYLIYDAGSSYTGSGDSKHVNGWVKKIGNTNFIFPVGNNSYLRPVALESLSALSEFNVKYNATTPFQTQLLLPVKSVDAPEYWTINKISGGSASVHLNWDNPKIAFPAYSLIDIRACYFTASKWTEEGGSATGNVTTTGDVTSNSISSFGDFVIGSVGYPLPITFISFTAQRKDNYSELKWITADEMNTDHFEVERSEDGIKFISIGSISSLNNSNTNEYTYNDFIPINGIAFYRIRCVDIDGRGKLSRIAAVYDRAYLSNDIRVLNPAKGSIIIRSKIDIKGPTAYALINDAGMLMSRGTLQIQSGMDNVINLPYSLTKGIYFLRLHSSNKEFIQKILIE